MNTILWKEPTPTLILTCLAAAGTIIGMMLSYLVEKRFRTTKMALVLELAFVRFALATS